MTSAARIQVGGILETRGLCLVGVMSAPDHPGLAAAIFNALGQAQINVQLIVQSIDLNGDSHIQFCVALEDAERTMSLLRPLAHALHARQVTQLQPVSHISVFGPDFRQRPGLAGAAFGALAEAGVNILAVSTSISTISCIIRGEDHASAAAGLRSVFEVP